MKRAKFYKDGMVNSMLAVIVALYGVGVFPFVSCADKRENTKTLEAIALIEDVYKQDDNRTLELADSLEKTGVLSKGISYFWQGYAYNQMRQRQVAQYYWDEAMKATANSTDPAELEYYAKAASYLTGLYLRNNEFTIALQTAMTAVNHLEQQHCDTTTHYTNLLIFTGCCRVHFDHHDPTSEELFTKAYQMHLDNIRQKGTKEVYRDAVVGLINITYGMALEGMYEQGLLWAERMGQIVDDYREHFADDSTFIDRQWGRYKIYRAIALEGMGRHQESAHEYDEFMLTAFSHTLDGLNNAADYLSIAERWKEAADCYTAVSHYYNVDSVMYSLDLVQHFMLKKFKANMMINRMDSANLVARNICTNIDSVISRTRITDAIGLETIRQKNTEIAEHEMKAAEWQKRTAFLALGISMLIFIAYTVYRHRVQRRLAIAHNELKVAYSQLEETTTAKERMESELRIARDIQMSMVPSTFPEREGLDMDALMTPAKEVGGDLYGYVLQGDKLYFVLGDVSGKGVPASLFMAQATRLFRTLATQGMMSAEICTRMNDALSGEDNVNAMFVTMFLGLIDLTTGHLSFCNAGHNAPVVGVGSSDAHFLQMQPNAPIGLWPGLVYEGEELPSINGQPLFIYSDGLNEAENVLQEQFGDDHLIDILRRIGFESSRQVIETLAASVETHRSGAEPNDDLTMMCLRVDV